MAILRKSVLIDISTIELINLELLVLLNRIIFNN